MSKIGFIGIGNMGYAMLKGSLNKIEANDLLFTDKNIERMEAVAKETGVTYVETNEECVKNAKYIVLAIKPQFFEVVLNEISGFVTSEHIVISIAPGITIDQIKSKLGNDTRIVRAMPNTPALVGEGMTGVAYNEQDFEESEINMINTIFSSIGKSKKVDEKLMSAVVCASGSSPAYVYMFIEALADSVVRCGMSRQEAYEFAAQTVYGSAKMVIETGMHPGVLKDMVCSPAGTTIEAVKELEDNGFRSAIMKASEACFNRANNIK